MGCYPKQALVIVHYGGGSAEDILAFSRQITTDVADRFGIQLEREVNVWGGDAGYKRMSKTVV
ncbi:MAG: hypothetical protein R2795_04995 [Saprospiraceae bacterium]